MSQYFEICEREYRHNNWALYEYSTDKDRITLRSGYRPLACPVCGKINIETAIASHREAGVSYTFKFDVCFTRDAGVVVSARFAKVFSDYALNGFRFVDIPGYAERFFALPTCEVETDVTQSGFEEHGDKCANCGLPGIRNVGPFIDSLSKPAAAGSVFVSRIFNIGNYGAARRMFCDERFVHVFKKGKLTGIDFAEPI